MQHSSSLTILKMFVYGKKRISFVDNKGHRLAHRGGGHKKNYLIINFTDNLWHIPGIVLKFKYDPNRSARVVLVSYPNGLLTYILAPAGCFPGFVFYSGFDAIFKVGTRLYFWQIPLGTRIYNIEGLPNLSGIYARSAGVFGVILRKTSNYVVIRLPSKELKMFSLLCLATIGQVSNLSHRFTSIKKAGVSRLLGRRPVVRGVAKNPVDHPHGGGEGKTSGGRPSSTPWGKLTKGQPTRCKRKQSIRTIVRFKSGQVNPRSFIYKH